MKIELPELQYSYDALEPYIDEETMKIHHTKHHKKYVEKYKAAVQDTELEGKPLNEIFPMISKVPFPVASNGGQVYNHNLFWRSMAPGSKKEPEGALAEAITKEFGSFDTFKEKFSEIAATQFGSGWAWLISNDGKVSITSTSNHINPLMDIAETRGKPLFCIDVWEHAYYLKYKNKRPDFIKAFWNLVNWTGIELRFEQK